MPKKIEIRMAEELDQIRDDLYAHYVLVDDIDVSSTIVDFEPIGSSTDPFRGVLDGKGNEIHNLQIGGGLIQDNAGLFEYVEGAEIRNVKIVNSEITGGDAVGALAGYNGGDICDSSVDAEVTGGGSVGGVVGKNDGKISSVSADVNVGGAQEVGGLAGKNDGEVENSQTTGIIRSSDITGSEDDVTKLDEAGGLVGNNYGTIHKSESTANVTGQDEVGGLAGTNRDTIRESKASGDIVGGGVNTGGVVGANLETVETTQSTGDITGEMMVGGLAGQNDSEGDILNSSADGEINAISSVGGFVGTNFGTVKDSSATSNVVGEEEVGGFAGRNVKNEAYIQRSYSTGNVSGDYNVGGLVGKCTPRSKVEESYSIGKTTGKERTGGLVGMIDDQPTIRTGIATPPKGAHIEKTYATGEVCATEKVGGLVGVINGSNGFIGDVYTSYFTGNVEGRFQVGGLAGGNDGTIGRCYVTGSIDGDRICGSLIGENTGSVFDVYSDLSKDIIGNDDGKSRNAQQVDTEDMQASTSAEATGLFDRLLQVLSGTGGTGVEMPEFDFNEKETWSAMEEEYPVLEALDTQEQLTHRT